MPRHLDSHGSWIPMMVVSTGLGREEWGCGVGLAEWELGLREESGSTFGEREGPKAWGIGTDQGRKGQCEARSGETVLDTQRGLESELAPGARD